MGVKSEVKLTQVVREVRGHGDGVNVDIKLIFAEKIRGKLQFRRLGRVGA